MKKLTLTIIMVGMAALCHAQGYVTVAGTIQNYTNKIRFFIHQYGLAELILYPARLVFCNKSTSGDLYYGFAGFDWNDSMRNMHLYGDSTY